MGKKTWNYIFGALLIIFGIIFIISPQGTFQSIVLAGGIILITYAIVSLLGAIISKNPYASYSIGSSIIGLIFGIILVNNTEGAVKLIPILLGFIYAPFWLIGVISLTAYFIVISTISVKIALKRKANLFYLLASFFTLHISYGWGSLLGIIKLPFIR